MSGIRWPGTGRRRGYLSYTKIHATSKAVVLGVVPILLALMLTGDPAILAQAALVLLFVLLTAPVATYAVGRASFLRREPMRTSEAVDESARAIPHHPPSSDVPDD